ncbi:hypothetical protein GYMLUDRAFT_241001 [Collybiopsis luxurians FD-317 M1]|nr:hypothetical protein GYMLUDRAFT_241001 [Collybiopsis luxurians FD-317 M1]
MNEHGNLLSILENRIPIMRRGYKQEMLDESLRKKIIIAMDMGSGKTHTAVLHLKHDILCEQQCNVIKDATLVSVGLISGAPTPRPVEGCFTLEKHPVHLIESWFRLQVLLDALRCGYI